MLAIPLATEAVNHGVNHVKNGLELYTGPVVTNKLPVPSIRVREHKGRVFYEAMFRYDGKQVGRRVGPAWLEPDGDGGFRKRKGRIEPGYYNDRTVHVRAAEIVERYVSGEEERERATREKLLRGPTFREVAQLLPALGRACEGRDACDTPRVSARFWLSPAPLTTRPRWLGGEAGSHHEGAGRPSGSADHHA